MNYSQYLQNGGELAQPTVEKGLKKEEVVALVLTIIKGDDLSAQEAAKALVEAYKADPENGTINDYLAGAKKAAENGNQDAARFVQIVFPLLEQMQAMKCGGSIKKVRKACGGKMKKDKCGGKMKPKKASVGCKCTQLKRVGGRLIEVDCNDVPIDKKQIGGRFFRNPFSSWAEFKRQFGYPVEWLYNKITTSPTKQDSKLLSDEQVQELKDNSRKGVEKINSQLNFPELSTPKISIPATSMQLTLNPKLIQISKEAIIGEGPQNELPEVTVVTSKPYKGLFSGDLRSLQARRDWVRTNSDYLKSLGWTDEEINNYRGQANLNLRLAKQISGLDKYIQNKPQLVDIYDPSTAKAPYAQVNPIVAARKEGGKLNYSNYLN